MATPEKFNLPAEKEIEFMGWKESVGRRIEGNRLVTKGHDEFLDKVNPYSLKPEDMEWDKKIRSGDFDPDEFQKFQRDLIPLGKDHPRVNFMRSLTEQAKNALEEKELRKKIK